MDGVRESVDHNENTFIAQTCINYVIKDFTWVVGYTGVGKLPETF